MSRIGVFAAAAGYRAVQSTPLKAHNGIIVGMLSTHFRMPHRVSERDEQLLDLYARTAADLVERLRFEQALKDADRRKDEFLATLAHELRNPLAPISAAVQILKATGPSDPEAVLSRDMIERQVEQIARLLDDLLDVSRITRNKLELRKSQITLAYVAQSALETSRPLIDEAGHELTVVLPSEPIYLDADPVRLAQVFSNLLNNAAKYTPDGGRIRLTAERQCERGHHLGEGHRHRHRFGHAASCVQDVLADETGAGAITGRDGHRAVAREDPDRDARRQHRGPQRRLWPGKRIYRASAARCEESRRIQFLRMMKMSNGS